MPQYRFNWKELSVIAGISYWKFHFCLFNGSIKSLQIVEFTKALQAITFKRLLMMWDGLKAHRSKVVHAYVEFQRGRIKRGRLPVYAPEVNPFECISGYRKHHAMPNCGPRIASTWLYAREGTSARCGDSPRSRSQSGNRQTWLDPVAQ